MATSVLVMPFRGEARQAHVPVVIEVDGAVLLDSMTSLPVPVELYVYAIARKGRVHDYFSRTFNLDLTKVGPVLAASGLKFYGDLKLPPGDYDIRVLVREGQSGRSGMQSVALHVPDYETGESIALPPLIPDSKRWLMIREAASTERSYPFVIDEQPFMPGAAPTLFSGQPVQVVLVGYNLGEGDPDVSAEVRTREGKPVGKAVFLDVRRAAAMMPGTDVLLVRYTPQDIESGEYELVVTLAGQSSSIPFELIAP